MNKPTLTPSRGTCSTCYHYLREEGEPGSNERMSFGECRRYPPTVQVMNMDGDVCPATFFPDVDDKDYCGDYRPLN